MGKGGRRKSNSLLTWLPERKGVEKGWDYLRRKKRAFRSLVGKLATNIYVCI
jgi:hypothetical protein